LSNIYGTKREGIEKILGNPPFTPAFIATLMVSEGIKLLLGKKKREKDRPQHPHPQGIHHRGAERRA